MRDIDPTKISTPTIFPHFDFTDLKLRVYCPICKGGDNAIWEGTYQEWSMQLALSLPPRWFQYAMSHQEAHPGHTIMVKYPNIGDIPLSEVKEN